MAKHDQAAEGHTVTTRWLNPRRKRFWAIVLFLTYSLFGFLAVPRLLEKSVTDLLQGDLGRDTRIGKIQFNPYVLSLRVQDLAVKDTDGEKLASLDEFYANFQWASLLKWAWTFSDVQFHRPFFHLERFGDGSTRIGRLLDDFAALDTGAREDVPAAERKTPRLIFRKVVIENGIVDATDRVPARTVEMRLAPINAELHELSTIPGQHGLKSIDIRLPGGASLRWSGKLALMPLTASGELQLERLQIEPLSAYLEDVTALESVSAVMSCRLGYQMASSADGTLTLDVDGLEVFLEDIRLSGLQAATEFADVQRIALRDGKFRLAERSLHFGAVDVTEPRVSAQLGEDGKLDLLQLAPSADAETSDGEPPEPSLPWHLGVGEFTIDGGRFAFTDHSITPTAAIALSGLRARATGYNNEPGVMTPFDLDGTLDAGGSFSASGEVGVLPEFTLTGNALARGLALSAAEPYLQQFLQIGVVGGAVDGDLEFGLAAGGGITAGGSLRVPGLAVRDTLTNDELLAWALLDVKRFDLDDSGLRISGMRLEKPYGRFVIFEDMSTNLGALAKPGDEVAGDDEEALAIDIGGIRISDGAMDFSDLSLPLPFAAHITGLDGTVSSVASGNAEAATIRLEGQVDEFGVARLEGSMDVLDPIRHTDVEVDFRNLLMTSLSPYTVAFAGYKIERGKLDLGLQYRITQGQLLGDNDIVLKDLALGGKVDHPGAASLPLGLAISLLKDADGVIDIDLPVKGDVNDPEFRIGGLVFKAFTGLITKVVAAPFSLLGKLVGADTEDFGRFEFAAGRSDLAPPELEQIAQLQQALGQRPELVIEVRGTWAPGADAAALKRIRLLDAVNQRLEGSPGVTQAEVMLQDKDFLAAVESLFGERLSARTLKDLKATHTRPPADEPKGQAVLDETAYTAELWKRLLETETVGDRDLAALAAARATAIRDAFLATGGMDETRITLGEPVQVESGDGKWVTLELAVASG